MGWGASIEKVAVVYNSLPREKVVPASKKSGEQWLVTAARLVPWKGMAVLINIMSELKSRYPHLKLKIIGDGPERVRLERLIMEKCLTGEVEIWGNLSHEKTLSYISSADLFVLNSGYEGLSHVLLEALSLGRPVLASRAGGNPEIIMS